MSWEGSDRKQRLPANWAALVAEVKRRDGGQCTWRLPSKKRCPRAGTDVDHRVAGDDHSLANLQLLCEHHHGKKSSLEGRQAKAKIRRSRYRPAEEHPGRVR